MRLLPSVTVALVGVGSVDPSPLLRESGTMMTEADTQDLAAAGAVGDVCLRFFDAEGAHVSTGYDARIVGTDLERLRLIPRRVAAAGESASTRRSALPCGGTGSTSSSRTCTRPGRC